MLRSKISVVNEYSSGKEPLLAEFSGILSLYLSLSINMSLLDLVDDTIEKGIKVRRRNPGFR